VTRGQLPQRAGLPGLNGGGAAAAVPPQTHSPHRPTDKYHKNDAFPLQVKCI